MSQNLFKIPPVAQKIQIKSVRSLGITQDIKPRNWLAHHTLSQPLERISEELPAEIFDDSEDSPLINYPTISLPDIKTIIPPENYSSSGFPFDPTTPVVDLNKVALQIGSINHQLIILATSISRLNFSLGLILSQITKRSRDQDRILISQLLSEVNQQFEALSALTQKLNSEVYQSSAL